LTIVVAISLLEVLSSRLSQAQTVPSGFVVENAFPTATFSNPVQIVFLPDGRKFVVEKGGRVWVMDVSGTKLSTPFIDLRAKVLDNVDKGLLGVAIDPDYALHPWVYFLYTVDPDSNSNEGNTSAFARLERYQASAGNLNVADLATRQILIGGSWSTGIPYPAIDGSHAIGAIRFGRDKTLLLSSGDAAHYDNTDAGGLDPGAFGAGKTDPSENIGAFRSQTLNSLCGKILRVDKETGYGLPSNPYWDGNPISDRSRVWVYGLRNQFRTAVRPGTGSTNPSDGNPGVLYIGDVGWNTYEELNIARTGGLNFGWPNREGPADQGSYKAVTSTYYPNPNVLYNAPLNPENPAPRRNPDVWWHHTNSNLSNPLGWDGYCSIGGAFYTSNSYPERYRNAFFLADYAWHGEGGGWIRAMSFNMNDSLIVGSDTLFLTNADNPVCIETDPISGDLFYIAYNIARINRIRYTEGNRNPELTASVSPSYGFSPLEVTCTSSATDLDGDTLKYKWDFGTGDTSNVPNTTYAYSVDGSYTVQITVTDGKGGSAVEVFTIVVGQTAPAGEMVLPPDTGIYAAGATVPLVASEVDTSGGSVTYQWDIDLLHNTHSHPSSYVLTGQNTSFVMTIPQDGDFYRYRIRLGVTQGALTTRDTSVVMDKPMGSTLLGCWPFDEGTGLTANDGSGNGRNGVLQNGPAWTSPGVVGGCLTFDGVNDYVDLPNDVFDGLEVGTIAAWVRWTDTTYQTWFSAGPSGKWIELRTQGNRFWIKTEHSFETYTAVISNPTDWHHLAYVVGGTGNTLYVDGVLASPTYLQGNASSRVFLASAVSGPTQYQIGTTVGDNAKAFQGSMDEVRVYGYALSQTEIQTLAGPSVLVQAKVVLEGPFNPGTGLMSSELRSNGYIPTTSPYADDQRTVSSIPSDIIDWVLVQLRSTPTGPAVASRSAFLRDDGRIVADDGTTTHIGMPITPGSYYLVVRHRNHLAIMSANAVTLGNSSSTLHDFSTGQSQAAGSFPMTQVSSGVFAMYAGDGNASGIVTAADANNVFGVLNATGYNLNDITLSGIVTAADANTIFANLNTATQTP